MESPTHFRESFEYFLSFYFLKICLGFNERFLMVVLFYLTIQLFFTTVYLFKMYIIV